MKVAMLSTVARRTPPVGYGPWEQMAYNIAEGLVERGIDLTLFATLQSQTSGKLDGVIEKGYEENRAQDAKVVECLHISHLAEKAFAFDIIHNHFDFLPLSYSRLIRTPMITTIHGFSSEKIIPVYQKYNASSYYISISDADRHPSLHYLDTIYHGIIPANFPFVAKPQDYLLFFGRIHPDKGTHDAIAIAKACKRKLVMAGIIQDRNYYTEKIQPLIDNDHVVYVGEARQALRKQLLGNAVALLHPIYFDEPFGLSVAEAMFCGTPVIAYNRGSMPELVKENISGYLVRNKNEAAEAVSRAAAIDRLQCHEYASEKFSYQTMIDKYVNAYTFILNRSKASL